jgi:hypothetical protein
VVRLPTEARTVYASLQASAAGEIRSVLLWDLTLRGMVVSYRRFGITYGSHLEGLSLEFNTAKKGSLLQTFRDNLWVPSSRVLFGV